MKLLNPILRLLGLEIVEPSKLYLSMVRFTHENHWEQVQRQGRLYEYLHNR